MHEDELGVAPENVVSDLAEVQEIFKNRGFGVVAPHPDALPFVDGTILHLDGEAHRDRRRILAPVFAEEHIAHIQRDVLPKAISRTFRRVANQLDPNDLYATVNLVQVSENIFWQVVSEVIGLDGVSDDASSELIQDLLGPIILGVFVKYLTVDSKEVKEVMKQASAAKARLAEHFVVPSYQRRLALKEEVAKGRKSANDLPLDILTVLLDQGTWDEDELIRESCLFLTAGTVNNTSKLIFCLEDLEEWFVRHPEDLDRRSNLPFLKAAFEETLRMHGPSAKYALRVALRDIRLKSTGRTISADTLVGLSLPMANRSTELFGQDADRFDPFRPERLARNVRPYGATFGAGPHLCLGLPMVVGSSRENGSSGIMAQTLQALFAAGVELVPDQPRTMQPTVVPRYQSFPVRFTSLTSFLDSIEKCSQL